MNLIHSFPGLILQYYQSKKLNVCQNPSDNQINTFYVTQKDRSPYFSNFVILSVFRAFKLGIVLPPFCCACCGSGCSGARLKIRKQTVLILEFKYRTLLKISLRKKVFYCWFCIHTSIC